MATNPYINRVDIVRGNGTDTLINISDTTATAADVSQGAYFYLASGERVQGTATGGVDIPQFEVVWYDDWSAVKEVTCNMTYAECQALSITGNGDGRASVVERDESMTDVSYYSATLVSYEGQGYLLYMAGTAFYDIRYNPNGTIQYIQQSSYRGAEGTPVATKGAVSNHSVSVTPSVTNTGGFISGGTKTGTAVTVTASELASGNLALAANTQSTSCVGYSTVSVAVPIVTYYVSSSIPTSGQGSNGDIWLVTS